MFDDQPPTNVGNVPTNLPVGEAEDMFGGDEQTAESAPSVVPAETPSALEAGVLKPKSPISSAPPSSDQPRLTVPPPTDEGAYTITEPTIGRRIMMFVVAVVVLVILGGGGWLVYARFIAQKPSDFGTVAPTPTPSPVVELPVPSPTPPATPSAEVVEDIVDEQVLFGEPIDKDDDGLDDLREQSLGTDPNNWDSDEDTLSDGDEILLWSTDPLNRDSDGDSYVDGLEVRSGYSPLGPGRIFGGATTTAQ